MQPTAHSYWFLQAHKDTVWGLATLVGCLVTASEDNTIKLWQPGSWTQTMNTLDLHDDAVLCVVNTRGHLFSGDAKGKIHVWAA